MRICSFVLISFICMLKSCNKHIYWNFCSTLQDCVRHQAFSSIYQLHGSRQWMNHVELVACRMMTFGVLSLHMFTTMQPNKPNHALVLIRLQQLSWNIFQLFPIQIISSTISVLFVAWWNHFDGQWDLNCWAHIWMSNLVKWNTHSTISDVESVFPDHVTLHCNLAFDHQYSCRDGQMGKSISNRVHQIPAAYIIELIIQIYHNWWMM